MSYKEYYIAILLASFSFIITAETELNLSHLKLEPSMPTYVPIIERPFFIKNSTDSGSIEIGSTGFTINFSDPVFANNSTRSPQWLQEAQKKGFNWSIQEALEKGFIMILVVGKFKDKISNGKRVLRRAHNITNVDDMEEVGALRLKQIEHKSKLVISCAPLQEQYHKSFLNTLKQLSPEDTPEKRFSIIDTWYTNKNGIPAPSTEEDQACS